MTPLKWKSEIYLQNPSKSKFQLMFNINTTGQKIIRSEEEFWKIEVDNIKNLIEGKNIQSTQKVESEISRVAKSAIIFGVFFAVVGGGVIILLQGLLKLVGMHNFYILNPGIGIVLGTALGISYGINRAERKLKS